MDHIVIEVSKEDKKFFEEFALARGMTLSDWALQALYNSVEEDFDIELIKSYLNNKNKFANYTNDDVLEMLGL